MWPGYNADKECRLRKKVMQFWQLA